MKRRCNRSRGVERHPELPPGKEVALLEEARRRHSRRDVGLYVERCGTVDRPGALTVYTCVPVISIENHMTSLIVEARADTKRPKGKLRCKRGSLRGIGSSCPDFVAWAADLFPLDDPVAIRVGVLRT